MFWVKYKIRHPTTAVHQQNWQLRFTVQIDMHSPASPSSQTQIRRYPNLGTRGMDGGTKPKTELWHTNFASQK